MTTRARPTGGRILLIGLALALVASAGGLALASSGGRPAASPSYSGGTPQSWNESSAGASNSSYQGLSYGDLSSDAGWASFVVRATNTSATGVELESWSNGSARTSLTACTPGCGASTASVTENASSAYSEVTIENLTSTAQVAVNGSLVSALGISSAFQTLSSVASDTLSGSGGAANVSGSLQSSVASTGSIRFTPGPLGLVPWKIPTGRYANFSLGLWNDSASYALDIVSHYSLTISGAFENASLLYGQGGNGSGALLGLFGAIGLDGGAGFGGPSVPAAGTVLACPENSTGTNVTPPSTAGENLTCRFDGSGTELADGFSFSDLVSTGNSPPSGNNSSQGPPPFRPAASPTNATAFYLMTDGPYFPSEALETVVPGSDLFGGAVADWAPFDLGVGGVSVGTGGAPEGGLGLSPPARGPAGGNPPARNGGGSPPADPTGPSGDAQAGAGPAGGPRGMWIAAIAIVGVGLVGAILWIRRRRAPPAAR